MDENVTLLLRQIQARAKEEAVKTVTRRRMEIAHQHSARGTLQSGGFIVDVSSAIRDAVRVEVRRLMEEMTQALRETYGQVPDDLLGPMLDMITGSIEGSARGFGEQIAEMHRRAQVPVNPQGELSDLEIELKRDLQIKFGPAEIRARLRTLAQSPEERGVRAAPDYDLFVSHASDDKADIVEPLVRELERRGLSVWYDRSELTMGDRLVSKIDDGLSRSRYGVVVLSRAFFKKAWPQRELHALAALEAIEGRKKILPVWHNVGSEDVAQYSPLLAAALGVASSIGLAALADEIERGMGRRA